MSTTLPQPKNVIYGLRCLCHPDAGVRYVGLSSRGMKRRLWHHKGQARYGSNLPSHRWIRKHGEDNIVADVLEVCESRAELLVRERFWIAHMGTLLANGGLNLSEGGDGVPGWKASAENRAKMSAATQKRKWVTAEKNRGSKASNAILDEETVRVAKELLWEGFGTTEVAQLVGVSSGVMKNVNKDRTWAHVPWPIGPRRPMDMAAILAEARLGTSPLTRDEIVEIRRLRSEEGLQYKAIRERIGEHASVGVISRIITGRNFTLIV